MGHLFIGGGLVLLQLILLVSDDILEKADDLLLLNADEVLLELCIGIQFLLRLLLEALDVDIRINGLLDCARVGQILHTHEEHVAHVVLQPFGLHLADLNQMESAYEVVNLKVHVPAIRIRVQIHQVLFKLVLQLGTDKVKG